MSLLDRLFRRRARDVASIAGPTRVELEARITSADAVVSPVTGVAGALIRWSLLEERTTHGGRGGGVDTRYTVLAVGLYGEPSVELTVDGHAVVVPLERARLALVEDREDGQFLSTIPPALAEAARGVSPRGPLAYREAVLRAGGRVRLLATLDWTPAPGAPSYRETAPAPRRLFVCEDDRVELRERL
ncbi:MAG: hypothetical protein KF729_12810 [Sandaracinaceae bacterium]|nr:hypothetical protein [Sandaracinaceae bacterium]